MQIKFFWCELNLYEPKKFLDANKIYLNHHKKCFERWKLISTKFGSNSILNKLILKTFEKKICFIHSYELFNIYLFISRIKKINNKLKIKKKLSSQLLLIIDKIQPLLSNRKKLLIGTKYKCMLHEK